MNIQALMKQAQNLQKDMLKAKEEIDNTIFRETKNNITIKCNGKKEIQQIEFAQELNLQKIDEELLADLLLISINDLFKKVDAETETKLGKFNNSLPGIL
ncbi:MAG: YbaB/EbfC family nucleoid-associated protein [Tenericutes bacterium]|jgi:DNA-binding protein YbaB|nr:YbaB/EbfC family nucleoid-associated protein [Mycoplasmatota bacterium]